MGDESIREGKIDLPADVSTRGVDSKKTFIYTTPVSQGPKLEPVDLKGPVHPGVEAYQKLLDFLPLDVIKIILDRPSFGERLAAVFIGAKPVLSMGYDTAEALMEALAEVDPDYLEKLDLVPAEENEVTEEHKFGFIINKEKYLQTVNNAPEYFNHVPDYAAALKEAKEYLTHENNGSEDADIKLGILFGYPKRDCESYARFTHKSSSVLDDLINPYRKRLHAMGFNDEEIEEITQDTSRTSIKTLTFRLS